MATCDSATRRRFEADLRAALETTADATAVKTVNEKGSVFAKWDAFCKELGHPASLSDIDSMEARLCYLLVFGSRYRQRKGPSGDPVRADTVEKALAAVGQGISNLGERDPRKQTPGSRDNHPLLAAFYKHMRDHDDPASRAYPANITIIEALWDALDLTDVRWGGFNEHVIDLIIVAYFWLLRPSEYLEGPRTARTQPFKLADAEFELGGRLYPAPTTPLNDENSIARLARAYLTFSDQKNAVRGEKVGHAATADPRLCPVKALARIVRRLRLAGAPPDTPLHAFYNYHDKKWYNVKSQFVTNALRHAAKLVHHQTGITPNLLSTRSLRPGGATALMIAGVDSDHIALLGRWKSDAMFRYLRIQAAAHRGKYSQRMLDHGRYTFAPGVYEELDALPAETPAHYRALIDHVAYIEDED